MWKGNEPLELIFFFFFTIKAFKRLWTQSLSVENHFSQMTGRIRPSTHISFLQDAGWIWWFSIFQSPEFFGAKVLYSNPEFNGHLYQAAAATFLLLQGFYLLLCFTSIKRPANYVFKRNGDRKTIIWTRTLQRPSTSLIDFHGFSSLTATRTLSFLSEGKWLFLVVITQRLTTAKLNSS